MTTNPILAEFHGKPAFLADGHTALFEACAAKIAENVDYFEANAAGYTVGAESFWDTDGDSFMSAIRPYRVKDGILTIPVRGVLRNRFPYQFGAWATGYEYIYEAMKRGVEDSSVKGIALHIDSPGGAVPGLFDLADRMYAMRGQKPIKAFAADMAASAAYCVASCADDITVTRTGEVGSIGVIGVHAELSKRLESEGITVTFIRSKPFKAEGHPHEPLRPESEARMQAKVDDLHNQFVAIVARNRSMEASAVDATEALTFMGENGVENGLADQVAPFDDALTAFAASFTTWKGAGTMADKNQAEVIALEDHNTAVAAAKAEGVTEGKSAGATEERARINAIIASDEGQARPKAALSAALKTGMSVDEAKDFLAGLPEEPKVEATAPKTDAQEAPKGAGAPDGMLEAAMNGTQNPQLGAQSDDGEPNPDDVLMANIAAAGLSGFKAPQK